MRENDRTPVRRRARTAAVEPRSERLPLDSSELSWEKFEAFCRALVTALLGTDARDNHYHFGKAGDEQDGIDILIRQRDGTTWGVQSKRTVKFSASNAQRAIRETTYAADHYILLVRAEVTRKVRDVIDQHPQWQIWDVRDISHKVRHELPPPKAVALVDAFFGSAVRHLFLGVHGPLPFRTPSDYFRIFDDDETRIFHHRWRLVGRDRHIRALEEFLADPARRIAVVSGRGGIGKTRLLREVAMCLTASRHSLAPWFLAENVPLTVNTLDYLPPSPSVIFVDDAHRLRDLPMLLEFAKQSEHVRKLVFASRPYGVETIVVSIVQAGFDDGHLTVISPLEDLTRDDMVALASEAIGERHLPVARSLAAMSPDSPLVTVVAAKLLRDRSVSPEVLAADEAFRHHVLHAFRNEMLGKLGSDVLPENIRNTLQLIAAIAPFSLRDTRLLTAACEFLDLKRPALIKIVETLEKGGLLIRRNDQLRITPDVLSDHILHTQCITATGDSTGYVQAVFERFSEICFGSILQNIAELDWRIGQTGERGIEELQRIWTAVQVQFRNADAYDRAGLLDTLGDSVRFQPERALDLIEFAILHPANDRLIDGFGQGHSFTNDYVLDKLPTILQRVAPRLTVLPRVYDLLWRLACSVKVSQACSASAMQSLLNLAKYAPEKPLIVNEHAMDAVESWLAAPDAHDHARSPLEVVKPLLERVGRSVHDHGRTISMTQFVVKLDERVQHLRGRALTAIEHCAQNGPSIATLRAIHLLEGVLGQEPGMFGHHLDEEQERLRLVERQRVIDIMAGAAAAQDDPVVHLAIQESLDWAARHASTSLIRDRARAVIISLPNTSELRLHRALRFKGHHDPFFTSFGSPSNGDRDAISDRWVEFIRAAAHDFLAQRLCPEDAVEALSRRLDALSVWASLTHPAEPTPHVFLHELAKEDPVYAAFMSESMVEYSRPTLAKYVSSILFEVWHSDQPRAIRIAQRILNGNNCELHRGLATAIAYWSVRWSADESNILRSLVDLDDEIVRVRAVDSLHRIGRAHPDVVCPMLHSIRFDQSEAVLERVCSWLLDSSALPPAFVSDDVLRFILARIGEVPNIHGWRIKHFLSFCIRRLPRDTVETLIQRAARPESMRTLRGDNEFRPLPYDGLGETLTCLIESEDYNAIFEHALSFLRGHNDPFVDQILFDEVSGHSHPRSIAVLQTWIKRADGPTLAWIAGLFSAPREHWLLERDRDRSHPFCAHPDFFIHILERADIVGREWHGRVLRSLQDAWLPSGWSAPVGEPPPVYVRLRDRAAELAAKYPRFSCGERFFRSLADAADVRIRSILKEEEERDA
jgi:hypothetical protein